MLADQFGQAGSFDIVHREERLAGVFVHLVDGDDVRVLQVRRGLRFGPEPL